MNQITAERERHFDLVKMGIDNPELAIGLLPGLTTSEVRQRGMRNLYVAHWAMQWDTGTLSRPALRSLFDRLLNDRVAREWWASLGPGGWSLQHGPRRQVFLTIADASYSRACERLDDEHPDAPSADAERPGSDATAIPGTDPAAAD
jgi:hypothetical protein